MSQGNNPADLPIEVSLVNKVKACRTCKWFWGGVPPYGPYPSYDWNETFPEEVRKQLPQEAGDMPPIEWLKARAEGYNLVEPAIMHGCRKAPIMTIGINPNMTSYFTSTSGARWAYPHFSEDAAYAYYYRHQTIFQESLSLDLIRENIKPGSEVKAEEDGWITDVTRCSDHRWLLLILKYKDREDTVQIELAWTPEARYVMLFDKSYDTEGEPAFKKGDVISGLLEAPKDIQAEIYENCTGYYQRFINVLTKFKEMVGGELTDADLRIGEDVEQHDMIGCASPGWSTKYDIPTERITQNCVTDHGYVVAQLLQSQPQILVIVGSSSMGMFGDAMGKYMDLEWEGKDIYQLMKETTERKRYLTIDVNGISFKARLIASPHFSYDDNFYEQSRFSEEAWTAFKQDFADDYKILETAGRVNKPSYDGTVPIRIEGKTDPLQKEISAAGWGVIMAYYYDPYEMMASVLTEMYNEGTLTYNKTTGHLTRAQGPCQYCVNTQWKFPEGCLYGNDKETPFPPGTIAKATKELLT